MNKINETQLNNGLIIKKYQDEGINNILDLINRIQTIVNINYIEVKENVEMDMQTYNGLTYSVKEFKNAYPRIKDDGEELSYIVVGSYNNAGLRLQMKEGKKTVTLITDVSSLELDNMIQTIRPGTITL